MATTGSRDWAFAEASRRAAEQWRVYIIYKHTRNPDYIIRNLDLAPPSLPDWRLEARAYPNGTFEHLTHARASD